MPHTSSTPRQFRFAEGAILITMVLEGLFPILIHEATNVLPPFLFAACSMILAGLLLFPFVLRNGDLRLLHYDLVRDLVMVALFVMVFPVLFIFTGTQMTSGINTGLLMQAEMVFTFLFCTVLLREPLTRLHLLGALTVLFGTVIILWNGSFSINRGEVMIIIGTAFYPIGNLFAARALRKLRPETVILLRYIFAACIMLPLGIMLEGADSFVMNPTTLGYILVYAIAILMVSKFFWYQGLRRIPVGRATFILSANPVFVLLFAFLLLSEVPTLYQWMGLMLTLGGVWMLRGGEE